MIHRFRVQNFKSLGDVQVDLSPVTVLVGKSGAGKSNFVEALRFLRDVLSGRWETTQNIWPQLRSATQPNADPRFEVEFSIVGIRDRFIYAWTFPPSGPATGILEERLALGDKCLFHQQQGTWIQKPEVLQDPGAGAIAINRIPSISDVVIALTALTTGIGCYAFPSNVLTGGRSNERTIGLEDDARNYLDALKEVVSNLQDLNVRRSVVGALQRVNPSVSSVELDNIQNPSRVVVGHRFDGKTLALQLLQESDGFRRFYAHLLALYQQPPKQTLIFEHPEDGIHPGALSLLAEEFRAAAENGRGQVILTTHSPELLDHFDVVEIRVVELNGFDTQIGVMSAEQFEAIRDNLLSPGELLTVDPARMQLSTPEAAGA